MLYLFAVITMDTKIRLALSYYKEISALSEEHHVYLVQHQQTGRICVKKELYVFNPEVYRQLQEQPVRHTPRIFELYQSDGVLYVIEEYISGDSLETILQKEGNIPPKTAFGYMTELCDILSDLHSRTPAVIHRDIKPSNIIITPSGELVLLDFNAARNYSASKTEDTKFLGTRGYAAPEQYGVNQSDERSDIFSLGVLMNVMLTGEHPSRKMFQGKLAKVIEKCINVDPQKRYSSVNEIYSKIK